MNPSKLIWRCASLLGMFCLLSPVRDAWGLSLDTISIGAGGRREVNFSGNPASYYILYRGTVVTNISQPITMALGAAGVLQLRDISAQAAAGFYRVLEVPQNQPLDTDGDGMDDVFELNHAGCLDPLDPTDASADCDGDGRSNLQEYFEGTNPMVADATPKLVINEIDYDQPGQDTQEFVEILNTGTNTLDVSHYALAFINGANNLEYLRIDLAGTLAGGAYLVAASTNVIVATGAQVIPLPAGMNNIQNGSPDGVALINVGLSAIMDALSYGGPMTAATVTGFTGTQNLVEGTPTPAVDSNAIVGALIRSPNGHDSDDAASDWQFTTTPTPGSANTLTP